MSLGTYRLIAGLGNPGSKYLKTRHNIGFMALEEIAKKESIEFKFNKKLFGQLGDGRIGEKKIRLLKPTTYMNDSGRSVFAAMQWFNLDISQLLIIVDDMDLPLGKLRFREGGGSGGHNGLKNIIQHLGREDFSRLRIGIGPPSLQQTERKEKTVKHVLGEFNKQESKIVDKILYKIIRGLELIETFGLQKGVTYINSFNSEEDL